MSSLIPFRLKESLKNSTEDTNKDQTGTNFYLIKTPERNKEREEMLKQVIQEMSQNLKQVCQLKGNFQGTYELSRTKITSDF